MQITFKTFCAIHLASLWHRHPAELVEPMQWKISYSHTGNQTTW